MKAEYRRTDTIHLTMSVDEAEKVRTLAQDARDHKDLYWALNTALNELAQAERPAPAPAPVPAGAEAGPVYTRLCLMCARSRGLDEFSHVAVKDGEWVSFVWVCKDCQRELFESGHCLTRADIDRVLHRDKWSAP